MQFKSLLVLASLAITSYAQTTCDAQAILGDLQALLPNIQQSLTDIVARKAALQALPLELVPALFKKDLEILSEDKDTLASSFIACAPDNVIPAGEELLSQINDAFGPAIAAFA
ncbi:hypothetical protein C0993_012339 [Termitomyces sp. T159_Od127]|nr:hypothetical protein C0993_012339 [Termitomyces sp. T159_Od127]